MDPNFVVPAEYFYALAAKLPPEVVPETRYKMAGLQGEKDVRTQLRAAIERGTISDAPAPLSGGATVTPEQAARRLRSLGRIKGPPVCKVPTAPADDLHTLIAGWLNFVSAPPKDEPADDIQPFWLNLSPSAAKGHLRLVMVALTKEPDPVQLIQAIQAVAANANPPKPLDTVQDLTAITDAEWTQVFKDNPSLLPAFTKPGTLDERISAFLRRVEHFFDVTFTSEPFEPPAADAPPSFGLDAGDPLQIFFDKANFDLGQPVDMGTFKSAAAEVFPDDPQAQQWLIQAVLTLAELFEVTSGFGDLQFSLMEALYARGFTSKSSIASMNLQDFTDALTGTIAHEHASQLWMNAGGAQSPAPGEAPGGQPINPDGSLVNCVPPPHLSPFGPVAYLHELLKLSADSTCSEAAPPGSQPTIAAALEERRGPVGDLHVTRANVATPLPLIDLVNECLEAVATNAPMNVSGVVHDTATLELHGHKLKNLDSPDPSVPAHDPATLFAAMAEHSSPATPVKNPGGYDKLRSDFSAPILPYSQPLDISRSYLKELRSTRYAVMRRFRSSITEFVLAPDNEPSEFRRHLWRYPVRWEIAREYIGIAPEEEAIFTKDIADADLPELYGFLPNDPQWIKKLLQLPVFLEKTGLTYCELVELIASEWVKLSVQNRRDRRERGKLPQCEPCCLDDYVLVIDDPLGPMNALKRLAVFIRLWRKLQQVDSAKYSFAELRDICEVLVLFHPNGTINPDFARQLVGFQLLRDHFSLALVDPRGDTVGGVVTGAERTHLLALWVGPGASKWGWAVNHLLWKIRHYAQARFECGCRPPEFLKLLAENLTPLSVLAGFAPADPLATWHAHPTHTLRFAEVLAKIYASTFGVGELLFLFTVGDHLNGDDPLPLASNNETLDSPLDLPDDDLSFSMWELRRKLLDVEVSDEEAQSWTWARIDASLREEFGFDAQGFTTDPLVSFAQHFFPTILEQHGSAVAPLNRQYRVKLNTTAPLMWNTPPHGPFRYDATEKELWTELPLPDEAILKKISRIKPLSQAEQQAVQDLYFSPRTELARFAFLFPSFIEADERLIQEPDNEKRWRYFQRAFALAHARCRVIAEHLQAHVAGVTSTPSTEGWGLAWALLKHLFADENKGQAPWEADDGKPPAVTWAPPPSGGAFAALLGLLGTGLRGELRAHDSDTIKWIELRGPMDAFGAIRNDWNAPAPTLLPAMDLTLTSDELRFVGVRNGFALQGDDAERLGGAQGFCVTWRGVLLVESAGSYSFFGGSPTPEGEKPAIDCAEGQRWRVTLTQGQKSWVVLSHNWHGKNEHGAIATPLPLKRGTYDLVVDFVQCPPVFDRPDVQPSKTGFQLKYAGPDTSDRIVAVPSRRLFVALKDSPLHVGRRQGKANEFLELFYFSTLRDVRRTYQRVFKSLLFAHRLALSAKPAADSGQSEIGYMLDHAEDFEGLSFYHDGAGYKPHRAWLNFNLLPVGDTYHPPDAAQDQRSLPSVRREQAIFDWWERLFDYTTLRQSARKVSEAPVWLAFHEASESHPDDPAHLLRHMGVDLSHAELVQRFYPKDQVTSAELEDERWAIRVFRADEWLRRLVKSFACEDVRDARPDLWASDDPGKVEALENESGNQNLTRFVQDGYLENGEPLRYEDLKRLNDGLRERARAALLAYLCGMERVPLPWGGYADAPKDLSELLLIDVEAGLCQRASRIEEAITAVQIFVQRARLGLEPNWNLGPEFVLLWERRFASLRVWQACKRRALYKENFIEWEELEKARASEGFRFLEDQLRSLTLTVAAPAGLTIWNGKRPPVHPGIQLLQVREPSVLAALTPPREGFSLLGTPERHARPSWLTAPGIVQPQRDNDDRPYPPTAPPVERPVSRPPIINGKLPYWIEAAIRLGARFVRVAAAGLPVGASVFDPFTSDAQGCCVDCGKAHPPVVDEYYFWILDSRSFAAVAQDADIQVSGVNPDDGGPWHDENSLPKLLYWKSAPMVHLFWARVHNGELKQMRRSAEGVCIDPDAGQPDLAFVERIVDSLYFKVTGGKAPPGYEQTPDPGFRYDLPTDAAEVLPPVVAAAAVPASFFKVLPAYPYFVYFTPGAPLIPPTFFSQAVAVATVLRAHCRFEAALKWYEEVFDPLDEDAGWCRGRQLPSRPTYDDRLHGGPHGGDGSLHQPDSPPAKHRTKPRKENAKRRAKRGGAQPADAIMTVAAEGCCKGGAVTAEVARDRAITLDYLETLLDWGDALMRRHSPEAFQQARLIFDTSAKILGPTPRTVFDVDDDPTPPTVENFVPSAPPLNPRLMALYERVEDRLALIHACLNARRLRNGTPILDMLYFGDSNLRDGWQTTAQPCADDADWCLCACPYRFVFLVQKALELAGEVRGLGGLLLAAYEKGDAEYLASLRAGHERQLLTLALEIRQNQWREADWQVQALKKTKEIAQTRLAYYLALIANGLNAGEIGYETLMGVSIGSRTAANVVEAIAQAMGAVPDVFSGIAGFGGTPLFYMQLPVGTKLAGVLATAARILNGVAEISGTGASLSLTEGGWERREEEWLHQVDVLKIEIEQIERQILAGERRRDTALRELNNHQRQLEQSAEVQDFLRDKFTAHELYLFLQKETAALHYQMYELALHAARQAQRAFNYERGHTAKDFLKGEIWDDLHEGLLAGDRLDLALRRMEKAYLCENLREYELTKHISLRQLFPRELLQLKVTGRCELELPEWLFDLDYPGHYMRRIKNVSLTIPCVVGPFAGVHCRLTLLSSQTRIDPRLSGPVATCCDKPTFKPGSDTCGCCGHVHAPAPRPVAKSKAPQNGYTGLPEDTRIVKQYAAMEAIATSSGQNDTGLFELNFRDERYLPFEFSGAVSRWRIELPPENNYFDLSTLTDVVLHLNYTAREGGDVLRRAAAEVAKARLPDAGWRLFDVKVEFPDEWHRLAGRSARRGARELELALARDLFPYLPGQPSLDVTRVELLFEVVGPPAEPSSLPAEWTVELTLPEREGCEHDDACPGPTRIVHCVASAEWPGLYHGVAALELGPVSMKGKLPVLRLKFPREFQGLERLLVLCGYRTHVADPRHPHWKP